MGKQSNNISIDDIFKNARNSRINTATNSIQEAPAEEYDINDIFRNARKKSKENKRIPTTTEDLQGLGNVINNTKRDVKYGVGNPIGKEVGYNADYIEGLTLEDTKDIDLIRGQRQGAFATMGSAAMQIIPKIALEIIGSTGHLLDFEAHYNTLTGEGDDYSNALTEYSAKKREEVEDWAPIYKENPNALFDPNDFASYVQLGTDLMSNLSSFAVMGAGAAGALGKGASLLAKLTNAGAKGRKILNVGEVAGTALSMSTIEGGMAGADVYTQVYDEALRKMPFGLSPEEEVAYKRNSDKEAKAAGGDAVMVNTFLTTPLNLSGAGTAVRSLRSVNKVAPALKRKVTEQGRKGAQAWKARLATEEVKLPGFMRLMAESGQEGVEEVLNEMATTTGTYRGRDKLGLLSREEKMDGLSGALKEALQSDQTKLSFWLGAIGGAGQHFLLSKIGPGKNNKQQKTEIHAKQIEFLIKKIDEFERGQENLAAAVESGDDTKFKQAQADVFNAQVFDSFINGAQEELIGLYQDIANLSPAEAKAKGYEVEEGSLNYKNKAQEKIKEITTLNKEFENIMARHNEGDPAAAQANYGEHLFASYLQKHNTYQTIDQNLKILSEAELEYSKKRELRGTSMDSDAAMRHYHDIQAADQAILDLEERINEINALDKRTVSGKQVLQDKYGIPKNGTSLKKHAIEQVRKATKILKAKGKVAAIKLNKEKAYFLEGDKTAEDWEAALKENSEENNTIIATKAYIEGQRAKLVLMEEAHKDFASKEGKASHIKKSQAKDKQRVEDLTKAEKEKEEKEAAAAEAVKREDIVAKDKTQKKAAEDKDKIKEEINSAYTEDLTEEELEQAIQNIAPEVPEVATVIADAENTLTEAERSIVEQEDKKKPEDKEDGDVDNIKNEDAHKGEETTPERGMSDNKIVEAGATFATNSKEFIVTENGSKKTASNITKADYHKELASSEEFQVGTEVTLEVDKTAVWTDSEGNTKQYSDYVNTNGTVDIDNVPIAIKHNGTTVAYVRTQEWINARIGTEYANVADSNDPKSALHGNAQAQLEKNRAIRGHIVNNGATSVKVINKRVGTLSKNVNGKALMNENESTPNVSTLAVSKHGEFYVNKDDIYSAKELINTQDFQDNLYDYNGIVFAEIPTPVKGKVLMAPLSVPMLSDVQIRTIINVLKASYGEKNNETVQKIFDEIGKGVATDEGILSVLRDITHTTNDGEASIKEKQSNEDAPMNGRHLSYDARVGHLFYATQTGGIKRIASLEDLIQNEEHFVEFLKSKLIAVNLTTLNSSDEITELTVSDEMEVSTEKHATYNEYLKGKLSTDIVSNPINDSEDSYFDNPSIEFDTNFLEGESKVTEEAVEQSSEVESKKDSTTSLDDIDEAFGFDDFSVNSGPDESVDDYSLDTRQKKVMKGSLDKLFVVDPQTDEAYNTFKQTQVVDSLMELYVHGKDAKEVFEKRIAMLKAIEKEYDTYSEEKKAKLKQRFKVENVDEVNGLVEEYDKVLRNWESFSYFVGNKIASTFGVEGIEATSKGLKAFSKEVAVIEGPNAVLEQLSFEDGASFRTNHKNTASGNFKMFLALQQAPKRSFLGLKMFMPLDTVYDDLQSTLAGTDPDYDTMIAKLALEGANKPYTANLIEKLENQPQQLKNEFVVAFSKQYNPNLTILWSKDNKTGEYTLNPISTNRNAVIQKVEEQWANNQKTSKIVKRVKGELVIDEDQAKEFDAKLQILKKTLSVEGTQELLEMIGVDMPIEAIQYLKDNSVKATGKSFAQHFTSGIFYYMNRSLNMNNKSKEDSVLLELNNPLAGEQKEGTSLRQLASLTAQFSPSIFSSSHRDSEGKTIFSYSLNSHLSHSTRRLLENGGDNKLIQDLRKLSYSEFSSWAKAMDTDSKFRETFAVSYLDGLDKRYSSQKGVKRSKMASKEMHMTTLALFQNSNQGEEDGRKPVHFLYPTVSDKTTTPIITAFKHNLEVQIQDDLSYRFGPKTRAAIINMVKGEINRIENYVKPEDSKEKIKGYDDGGALLIYSFPELNDILETVEDPATGKRTISPENRELLFEAAISSVKSTIKETLNEWQDLGIASPKGLVMDSKYLRKVSKAVGKDSNMQKQALYAAIDLEVNYMIANSNILQLFAGDPALHFKKAKGKNVTTKDHIETTLTVVQKRLAKDIAPGMDGNFTNDKYKTVFLTDKKTDSKHLKEYVALLGEKADTYKNMEGTDAQEYTTLQEHLDVLMAYGRISSEQHARMSETKDNLSEEDLAFILQPMKPVYVGSDTVMERDLNKVTYVKSSSFPLIPQLTKGKEIDKLRVQMEEQGIQRASYISAAKLGATRIVSMWDGDTISDNFSLKGKGVTLSRKGFRIQQEVPYKESKKEVLTVSQMNKLLFEGILHIPGMEGLKGRKEEIRKALFEIGKNKLFKEIGVVVEGDSIRFKDLSKLQDMLIKEATAKGYPVNDLQALELSEDKMSFKTPLVFNSSASKFESLLLSLITNNVLKLKMPGKSYVQGSSAGFITDNTTSKEWSELTDAEVGGITWVGDVNLDEGLKFVRKGEKGGPSKGAQMLVPFYFRDAEGKTLNIKDYTIKRDGKTYIDETKMDKDLLKMIGARIPNQSHSSMLPIEIVGFLPKSMGDLVIVPDEITAQMGSDFDVDKLTTYNYNYTIEKNGTLSRYTKPLFSSPSEKGDTVLEEGSLTAAEVLSMSMEELTEKGYSPSEISELLKKACI